MPINVVTDLFNSARFLLYISKTKEFKDFAVEQQLSTSQIEEIAKQILVKHINPINSKLHLIEKLNECDHNENNYNLISLFIITNKEKLIKFVNNDFSSFKEILTALKSGKGQIKFIELMSNQLPTIINDSYKLQQILDILQEEDDVKYCLLDSLSDHLPNILQLKDKFPSDIAALKHFFNSKKQPEKKAVWKSTLEDILSPQDFIVLNKFINSEDSPDLNDLSYLNQITSIKYFLDLRDLTRIFLSKKPFIFNSIKDQLIAIINDSYRLQQILILSQLEDSQNIILNALSKELPRIIKDTPDLKRLLESSLGSKNQLFVIDLLNENLKCIIKNTDDLIQIIKILPLNDLNLLSPVNKANEVNPYKHFIDLLRKQEHLSTIVRNPEDWINLISNTPENKKEVIYKLLKEDFLPEIISNDLNSFLDFFVKKIPETTSKNEYETLINFLKDNLDISGIIRNIEDLNLLISAIPDSFSKEKYQILINFQKDQQNTSELIKNIEDLNSFIKNIPDDISKEKYQILINFQKDQQNTSELIKNIEDLNSFIKSIPEDISKEKYQIIIESLKDQKYLSDIIQQTEDLNEFIKKIPGNLSKEKYEIIISYLLNNKYFSRIINHTSLLSALINTIPDSIQEDKYQIIIDLLREQFAFTIKSEEQLGHFIKKIRDDLPKNKYQIIINALKDLSLNITNDISSFNSFIESIPEKFTEEKNKILINFLKEQKNISGVINNYEDLKCF